MKDLSTGSIPRHIATMSITMAIGILVQTLYFFIDLYFVSKLGDAAIAGVTSAGNIWFVVLALTQILNVGTVALVSHAVGAQQRERANLVFNQSLMLSIYVGLFVIGGVYLAAPVYMHTVGADEATARAGIDYLYWFAPGLGLQFAMIAHVRDVARHGHRQAHHGPADDHGAGERDPRAGADRGLGHGQTHGHGRRRPRQYNFRDRRRHSQRLLLPPAREIRVCAS